jgi:hypothetical protein
MKTAFRITGLFVIFVIFLSISVNGKTIFDHIYRLISPVTTAAQEATEDFFERSIKGTKSYSKKMFDNSVPNLKDSVKSKLASPQGRLKSEPQEDITFQEREELNDLIKNHR